MVKCGAKKNAVNTAKAAPPKKPQRKGVKARANK